MRILIATLSTGAVIDDYVTSLVSLTKDLNCEYDLIINRSALIDRGRNLLFFEAKKGKYDYLFFIDSDITFPSNGLKKLFKLNKDVATGIYYQRSFPYRPVIYNFSKDYQVGNLAEWPQDKPFKVDACGGGFLLIKNTVFDIFEEKKYEPFTMIPNYTGELAGEDTSFCIQCKKHNIEIWTDPTINLGHIRAEAVHRLHWLTAKRHLLQQKGMSLKAEEIQGWMSLEELDWLRDQSKNMESVLEIGAWKGRSTVALLESCQGIVYTVDHFKGNNEIAHHEIIKKEPSIFSQFADNVNEFNNLIVLKTTSKIAANYFPDKSIDMVFIDGAHDYQSTKNDIEKWMPKARKLICGHDYSDDWPEIKQAVCELINSPCIHESIWFKYL